MSGKKKSANALKNKYKKQLLASMKLVTAREIGPEAVALEVLGGNQYVRAVVSGSHLAESVPRFNLTNEEAELLYMIRSRLERYTDEDYKRRAHASLVNRQTSVAEFLAAEQFADDMNKLMDELVERALAEGQISRKDYHSILRTRKAISSAT